QSNFDPFSAAGGSNRAIDKSFSVTVTNGQIDLQLVALVSNPKISAIEITGGSGGPAGGFTPVRVNAGGPAFTDPGTGNLWSADTGFSGGATYSTANAISNTATGKLYQSERWDSPSLRY